MKEQEKNNHFSLNQIINTAKLSSLFFSAIAFFQYYFKDKEIFSVINNSTAAFLIVLVILVFVYLIWSFFSSSKVLLALKLAWVQPLLFTGISFLAVYVTGAYQSNYKFLFLFIIISTTIENDMRTGVIVASLSSMVVLGIDLVFAPGGTVNTYFESDLVLACAFLIISWTIGFYVKTEKAHIAELSGMVNIDSLTGLYNHRFFHDKIKELVSESNKKKTPLSLIFIDIDYFKHYNDLHGHQQGDEVLKILGSTLLEICGEKYFVIRYGGEEFAILMPETVEDDAFLFAEKIRIAIQDYAFYGQEYLPNENLTISLGVSEYPAKAKNDVELIRYADDALYRAKFLKKNRVEGYSSILEDLGKQLDAQNVDIVTSVKTLITVINARDKYTFRHVERVVAYCKLLADKLKLSEADKKMLIYGAYMHDIGKIDIAKEVLMKPTALTQTEWEQLKSHSENGVKIIQNVEALKEVVPIMLYHHEKYNGSGYPRNLKGEEIPYLARVLTVADSFDAMTSTRPYQKRKTFYEGIEEVRICSGTQFDPVIAEAFIEVIKENVTELN